MNASTLASLLQDLVNHSNHSKDLQQKLRRKLYDYEEQKFDFKNLRRQYNKVVSELNEYEDEDTDDDESPRPPTQYNIFLQNIMKKLKLENPNMKITELMTAATCKWPDEKIKIKHHKIKFLKEIADHKINKDMHKITNLIINNMTGSNFKW